MIRPALVVLLALAALLAACGQAASPTPEPTTEPTATPDATAAPETTPAPSQDDGTGGSGIPGFGFDEAPELAAKLPSSVGGQPLQVFSFRGDSILGSDLISDPSLEAFLESAGASASDLAMAMGIGGGQSSDDFVTVMAIQVAGANSDDLVQQFLGASQEGGMAGWTEQQVGGKTVQAIAVPGMEEFGSFYFFVTGDTLYYVFGAGDLAEDAVSQLP